MSIEEKAGALRCPKCGGPADGIRVVRQIDIHYAVTGVDADGRVVHAADGEVDWDSEHDDAEFLCGNAIDTPYGRSVCCHRWAVPDWLRLDFG